MEKQCYKCKLVLAVTEFYKNASKKDGLTGECKKCVRESNKKWYGKNAEKSKKAANAWYKNNFERYQIRHSNWYEANKEEISRKNKIWCEKNRDHLREYNKNRPKVTDEREKEKIAKGKKAWKLANPEKVRAYSRKAMQKALSNPQGRLNHRIKNLMWRSLRGKKEGRSWLSFVPYSLAQLKRHIEKQFTEGMSWDAFLRGEIHIDHIIPLSAFTYSSPEEPQFQICWALKNLRPMWAEENRKKSNKLLEPFQQYLL